MNQFKTNLFYCLIALTFVASDTLAQENNGPVFSKVEYRGKDKVYMNNPLDDDEFYNPILQGCYPDPAITRKDDDYYLVVSSFVMFPGVPIFHSKDLVNWTQIGHVLDRKSQLDVSTAGISRGIYAPGITYNPHNDTFYMITTNVAGSGNIVVKTQDPKQGWSDPISLNFGGIDPSIFFDTDGRAYVVHNDAPNEGEALYNGHRVIKIWEYDVDKDEVITGTDKIIVDGGVDLAKKPIWIEAPHLYKKNDKYYLMCAEGGTGDWHSEVIFISDSPTGPFNPAPGNPILTQRHFPRDRPNMVDWAGHADLIEGPDGKYYGVFLAVRPNEKGRVNTGRETFILPVDWSGTYPVFENGLVPLEPKLKMPEGVTNQTNGGKYFPNGNFTLIEDFSSGELHPRWIGLRGPREEFIEFSEEGLRILPFNTSIKDRKPTSTLFHRQQHKNFSFTASMTYKPGSDKDLAGITCLQNEGSNYVFGVTRIADDYVLLLERNWWPERGDKKFSDIIATHKINVEFPIQLMVEAEGDTYEFSYAVDGGEFVNVGGEVSGDILSTNIAGGFTGAMIGLYATSGNVSLPESD